MSLAASFKMDFVHYLGSTRRSQLSTVREASQSHHGRIVSADYKPTSTVEIISRVAFGK